MWSTWTENAKRAIEKTTEAMENAGDAITKAATQQQQHSNSPPSDQDLEREISKVEQEVVASSAGDGTTTTTDGTTSSTAAAAVTASAAAATASTTMTNLWSSMSTSAAQQFNAAAQASKGAMEATRGAVEHSRTNFEKQIQIAQHQINTTAANVQAIATSVGVGGHRRGVFTKRDPSLPLDVDALRDANVVYITDRIITMGHPATDSSSNSKNNNMITAERKLAAVGHLLNRRHDGRYLVFNLSEVEYDISILDDQVLTFSFPGSPSPPLGLLLKLLVALENWMKADERNVAVLHCLTGKGRTSMVTASFLCWMGEAGFGDINEALAYIAKCKQLNPDELTIPSQRRYASYFKNMLDGVRPSQPPLLLKRIIMSEAPKFAKGPPRENSPDQSSAEDSPSEEQRMGCAPYLQIFKAGKLIHTSAATLHVQQSDEELPFVQIVDGTVPFNIDQIIQGDVLIRCRHLTFEKKRVSMFRAAFHTGYVPPNVLRLTKSQLDGACSDKRFSDDFFLDLVFEKVDAEALSKHMEEQEGDEQEEETGNTDKKSKKDGKGPVVTASTYDTMLQGDSRFWDVIADKRKEVVKQGNNDPFWGPTVGRRRGEPKKDSAAADSNEKDSQATSTTSDNQPTPMPTFSIGNEFDFLPDKTSKKEAEQPQQRDSLMDALNALDDDEVQDHSATEEIVFDTQSTASGTAPAPASSDSDPTVLLSGNETGTETGKVSTDASGTANAAPSQPSSSLDTAAASAVPAPATAQADEDAVEDMDALLATTDDLLADLDLGDLDDDDDGDLEDLEAMLNS